MSKKLCKYCGKDVSESTEGYRIYEILNGVEEEYYTHAICYLKDVKTVHRMSTAEQLTADGIRESEGVR